MELRLDECYAHHPSVASTGRRVMAPANVRKEPSAEFLREPDEEASGPTDVAEPVRVFVLDHLVDQLAAVLADPVKRLVDVVHGEHDAEVAESIHRRVPV